MSGRTSDEAMLAAVALEGRRINAPAGATPSAFAKTWRDAVGKAWMAVNSKTAKQWKAKFKNTLAHGVRLWRRGSSSGCGGIT
jgi:hypothetical protein